MNRPAEPRLDRVDILRYRLLGETVEEITGDGGFGGTTITFSNGDKLSMVHWRHTDEHGHSS